MSNRLRAWAVSFGLVVIGTALLLAPSMARAGTYPLFSCDYPGATATGQRVWALQYGNHGSASCPAFSADDAGGVASPITYASWRAAAPNGPVSILNVQLSGTLQGYSGDLEFFVPEANASICPGTNGTTCSGSPLAPTLGLPSGAKGVEVQIRCPSGGVCAGYRASFLPKLVLNEDIAPSASISGGSLVSGGPQAGTRTVTFDAADADSGVAKVQLTLGGVTVAAVDNTRGPCSFDTWSPCPASQGSGGPVSVDTTQAPNGSQQLVMTVTDAAGNTKADARTVEVCNACKPTATTTTTTPTTTTTTIITAAPTPTPAGPAGGSDDAPPPRTPNGNGVAKSLTAHFSRSRTHLTTHYGRRVTVSGRLTTEARTPVTDAVIDVQTAKRIAGAGFHPTTTLRTDADGRFRMAVAARSSRLVRFGYRAILEDLAPSLQKDVDLRVRAPVSLRVNRHRTRNGRSVRFSGRISGVSSASRKAIEMQARVGRRWVSFGTTRLRSGIFTQSYRFRRTYSRTRYTFRAVVRSAGRWPFETTSSRHVGVMVTP